MDMFVAKEICVHNFVFYKKINLGDNFKKLEVFTVTD